MSERIALGIAGAANAFGGAGEVVDGVLESDVGAKQEPVTAGLAEGHAYASCVDDAGGADDAVELHVGVATDDEGYAERLEDGQKAIFGGERGEDLDLVAWGCVAEEDFAEVGDGELDCTRPSRDPLTLALVELLCGPLDEVAAVRRNRGGFLPCEMLQDGGFSVAEQAIKWGLAGLEEGQAFVRHGAGENVAADDDPVDADAANVVEHGLERGEVAVDVVEGCNAHECYVGGVVALAAPFLILFARLARLVSFIAVMASVRRRLRAASTAFSWVRGQSPETAA